MNRSCESQAKVGHVVRPTHKILSTNRRNSGASLLNNWWIHWCSQESSTSKRSESGSSSRCERYRLLLYQMGIWKKSIRRSQKTMRSLPT